jgi:hypothetical protein
MAYQFHGIESRMTTRNDAVDLSASCEFLPPIGMVHDFLVKEKVTETSVILDGEVSWYEEGNTLSPFFYNEKFKEEYAVDAQSTVTLRNGVSWDSITPLLHPALAGLEIGAAGLDEAFTKSMSALETLIQGRKTEMSPSSRQLMKDMLKRNLHPAALLARLSIMWVCANLTAGNNSTPVVWEVERDINEPLRMDTIATLDGYLNYVGINHNDTIYTSIEHISESYMLDVMYAACSAKCPIMSDSRWRVSSLWPAMQKPRVTYTSPNAVRRPQLAFTGSQIMEAAQRMCEILDCHNMFKEVLSGLQAFCVKPKNAGCYGGHNAMVLHIPRSDMKAACLGPMYAGISPQGMKTEAFKPPKFKQYMYGSAVKSTFIGCVLYEYLSKLTSAHPVAIALRVASGHSIRPLMTCEGSYNFWHNVQDRLAEVGWGCANRFIAGLSAIDVNTALHKIMDSSAVVWWLPIAKHMNVEKVKDLQDWMRPAQMTSVPRGRRWYNIKKENGVSEDQITVALRHMQAEVGYVVDLGSRTTRMLPMPTPANTRFTPPTSAYVQTEEFSAQAKFIIRNANPHAMYTFLRSMSVCTAHILDTLASDEPMFNNDVVPAKDDYEALDPVVFMNEPFVDAVAYGVVPKDNSAIRSAEPSTSSAPEETTTKEDFPPEKMRTEGVHGVFTPMVEACRKLANRGLAPHLADIQYGMQELERNRMAGGRPRAFLQIANLARDMDAYAQLSELDRSDRLEAAKEIAEFLNQAVNFAQADDLPAIRANYDNAVAMVQAMTLDTALSVDEVEEAAKTEDETLRLTLHTVGSMAVRSGYSFAEAVKKSLARGAGDVSLVKLANLMPTVPEDPNAGTESSQVFGRGMSPPGLDPFKRPLPAKSAGEDSKKSADTIGFAPPEPIGSSAEPSKRWADIVEQQEESGQAEAQ